MGHTLDALRSRNSASLGPEASMRSESASMREGGWLDCVFEKTTERPRLSWGVDTRAFGKLF